MYLYILDLTYFRGKGRNHKKSNLFFGENGNKKICPEISWPLAKRQKIIFRRAYVEIISGMEGKESCLTKQMWKWDGSQKEKLSGEEIALKINRSIIHTNKPKCLN